MPKLKVILSGSIKLAFHDTQVIAHPFPIFLSTRFLFHAQSRVPTNLNSLQTSTPPPQQVGVILSEKIGGILA